MNMNLQTMQSRLESLDCVIDVTEDLKHERIQAIDFELFTLDRFTNTSNAVFGRFGSRFQGGLLRLPKVNKQDESHTELRNRLLSHISTELHSDIEIRLEPEIELDEGYHYIHVEVQNDPEAFLLVTEQLGNNYIPPETFD